MAVKYITGSSISLLFKSSSGSGREGELIFGDEVNVDASLPPVNKRVKVDARGKPGYILHDQLGDKPALEIYFIDVGQGDATFIVTPGRKKILIDGGINNRAFGFLAWKYRFDRGGPPVDIDLLVLSHADGDHLNGLVPIIRHPRVNVRKIIHSGIAVFRKGAFRTALGDLDSSKKYLLTRHDSLHDLDGLALSEKFEAWRQAVAAEGMPYSAVDATTGLIDIGDPEIRLEVMGPRLDTCGGRPAYPWFGDEGQTINGHSVVFKLTYGRVAVMFPGDLNAKGAVNLLKNAAIAPGLSAHVLKAPHHGSQDFYRPFLEAVRPQISVISSGDETDYGHPRAIFIGTIGQVSRSAQPLVFSTELAANFVEEKTEKEERGVVKKKEALETLDTQAPDADRKGRLLYKRRLHGMINVRTDGSFLYAARRIAGPAAWEDYGPVGLA